ncbi:macro domain-containing protein [Bacillus wiedmannii]|uniref:macro domain-containing protein n=1 Tax=Bacillus wiedmannii TaxID=1890302 RepID=UPI00211D40BE|nr:macro domain-containing protein [Bacillus wiedmannii]
MIKQRLVKVLRMAKQRMAKIGRIIQDANFWKSTWVFPSTLFAGTMGFLTFIDVETIYKRYALIGLVILTLLYFVYSIIKKTGLDSISLNLDGSIFEISVGDIFQQDDQDFKVIAFNEYFDTKVDDELISFTSLNGQYLTKNYPTTEDIQSLDVRISNDKRLSVKDVNVKRKLGGKTTKYELGSVFKDGNYFLISFSKFDEKNEAHLRLTEYATCLLKFWDEAYSLYNKKTIVVPLLGSGITRHRDFKASPQDLLEVLIWTFKISKVKFKEPSKVKILIHKDQQNEINFYKLKEFEKNGI